MSKAKHADPSVGGLVHNSYLALRVILSPNITFATTHISGKKDEASSQANIIRTFLFKPAKRSSYENAPGGTAYLDERMLQGMLGLAGKFRFRVSEIAGGSHSGNSRHYVGIGFDVDMLDGIPVSSSNNSFKAFMAAARKLGATEVLGPGSPGHSGHVHVAWPRKH